MSTDYTTSEWTGWMHTHQFEGVPIQVRIRPCGHCPWCGLSVQERVDVEGDDGDEVRP